jgi:hypothetical protein
MILSFYASYFRYSILAKLYFFDDGAFVCYIYDMFERIHDIYWIENSSFLGSRRQQKTRADSALVQLSIYPAIRWVAFVDIIILGKRRFSGGHMDKSVIEPLTM